VLCGHNQRIEIEVQSNDPEYDEWCRDQLASRDAARADDRFRRQQASRVHQVIPSHWFAPASSECRALYVDGHFYGCISLSQAVAEGLSKFLAEHHGVSHRQAQGLRVAALLAAEAISSDAARAFQAIEGTDRNAIHHLNREIPRDAAMLEARAAECVESLYVIESEIFAFTVQGTAIAPRHPQYWTIEGGMGQAYLRIT
jgi:hypothetical protein